MPPPNPLSIEDIRQLFDGLLTSHIQPLHSRIAQLEAAQSTPPQPLHPATQPVQQAALHLQNPAPPTPARRERGKPATPLDFKGNLHQGRAFIHACNLYLTMCRDQFRSLEDKITWILSYRKEGWALHYAQKTLRQLDAWRTYPWKNPLLPPSGRLRCPS
jgi:hypothetical protein